MSCECDSLTNLLGSGWAFDMTVLYVYMHVHVCVAGFSNCMLHGVCTVGSVCVCPCVRVCAY